MEPSSGDNAQKARQKRKQQKIVKNDLKRASKPVKRRWSEEEKEQMKKLCGYLSIADISKKLGRSKKAVERALDQMGLTHEPASEDSRKIANMKAALYQESFWPQLQKQMTAEELEIFEDQYCEMMLQFTANSNIVATEKFQTVDLIRNRIALDRAYQRQRQAEDRVLELTDEIDAYRRRGELTQDERKEMRNLLDTRGAIQAHCSSFTKEIQQIQQDIKNIMVALKATRDQRIARLDTINTSFSGKIQQLEEF